MSDEQNLQSLAQQLKLAFKKKREEIGLDLLELTEAKQSVSHALNAVSKYSGDI